LVKTNPVVGVDDRGDIFVAWLEPVVTNGGASLWIRRFDSATASWAAPRHFDTPPFQAEASEPSLAVNGAGQALIGYLYGANDKQVRAAASLPDSGWSDDVVGGGVGYTATGVSAALGRGGDAVIAWAQDTTSQAQWRIAAAFRQGDHWTTAGNVDAADGGASASPSTSVDGRGHSIVAWTQGAAASSGLAAHVAYRDGSARALGSPFVFPQTSGELAFGIAVATNSNGLGAVAWQADTATYAARIYAPFGFSNTTVVNSSHGVTALPLKLGVTPQGTRWLMLGGRGSDPKGIFVSHCP
jgi:hypothetical protein